MCDSVCASRQANESESPDDAAQARIATTLSAYAGAFQGQSYPVGRLNPVVYPVDGGMEDWGYAAGWDVNAVRYRGVPKFWTH